MPPRRSYKKSTAGCRTCKVRRVKCDEVRPVCGNCKTRGTSCNFTFDPIDPALRLHAEGDRDGDGDGQSARCRCRCRDIHQHGRLDTATTVLGKSSPRLPLTPTRVPRSSQQLLEMRLLNHCTNMLFSTRRLIHDDVVCAVWSTEVFQLAFQSRQLNPLLDLLLGVSAQHLQLLDPTDTVAASAASMYFDRGLRTCNEMLSQLEENSCLLFMSSVLVALQSVLSRQEPACAERYDVPIAWFRALRGVNIIASAGRSCIMNSKLRPLLLDAQPQLRMDHEQQDVFAEFWMDLVGISEPGNVAAYESAIKHLHWIYVLGQRGAETHSLRRKLLAFPSRISPLFISLLEKRDPGALVITAHFFALIRLVDEIWWLMGLAKREILGLLTIVPQDWMWAMEWPVSQV